EQRKDYLFIQASGIRNNFSQVIIGTIKLSQLAEKFKATHIMADYRDVSFNVPLTEAFNLVKLYELKVSTFQKIVLSTIVNHADLEIAKFWESICKKRGFNNAVFLNIEEAESWLLKQKTMSL
ncbi:hypothetical protein, partial [Fulvivirga aurantia]|uniref:hypothetical protein n=1 Tax=Fulvivirga aurantia TaxID=2529383 RepID=UPI001627CCD4